ncbi:hypothetical protein KUTeg_020923 [Tegillarca granosa]|uniref:Uncharacterized protein n=1 Tax=Tegillarca granosa TaxID=220873 RepID=A0ABQ9EBZ3_TEGGR|nr:hypothetical protein KUTeg_020923 [Tegillarca granosa]
MGGTLSCAGGRYTEKDPDLKPYTCTHGKSSLSSKTDERRKHVHDCVDVVILYCVLKRFNARALYYVYVLHLVILK